MSTVYSFLLQDSWRTEEVEAKNARHAYRILKKKYPHNIIKLYIRFKDNIQQIDWTTLH